MRRAEGILRNCQAPKISVPDDVALIVALLTFDDGVYIERPVDPRGNGAANLP